MISAEPDFLRDLQAELDDGLREALDKYDILSVAVGCSLMLADSSTAISAQQRAILSLCLLALGTQRRSSSWAFLCRNAFGVL